MEPLYNTLYLIAAPAVPRLGEPPGYYAPVSEEAYQAGVILPGLKPAPGWDVIKTDDYLYPLYSSQTNKRLRKMGIDIRPGDGLKACQTASLNHLTTDDQRNQLRHLHLKIELATLSGYQVDAMPDWSGWAIWDSLEALGWVDGVSSRMAYGRRRRGYCLTRVGFEVVNIMAAVYGW